MNLEHGALKDFVELISALNARSGIQPPKGGVVSILTTHDGPAEEDRRAARALHGVLVDPGELVNFTSGFMQLVSNLAPISLLEVVHSSLGTMIEIRKESG